MESGGAPAFRPDQLPLGWRSIAELGVVVAADPHDRNEWWLESLRSLDSQDVPNRHPREQRRDEIAESTKTHSLPAMELHNRSTPARIKCYLFTSTKLAKDKGIARKTLERAKNELGVEAEQIRYKGKVRGWKWALPDEKSQSPNSS